MRRLAYPIILCLFVISAVFPLTAQQKKQTAAVLEFASPNLSKEDMLNLTNRFRSLLSQTNSFDMIERDKMKDILKEQDWVLTENCNSAECAVQVGQLLGAEIMFAGDIGKMGQLYTIDIRMLDVSTGKILLTKTEDYKGDIEGLLGVMKLIANEFAGIKTEGRGKGAIILAGQESFGTAVFKLPVDGATPVINGVAGNPVFSKDIKLNLPAGVHKIKFTKSGYAATQEFTVQIKENEETSQAVEMKEDKTATAGADLSLNFGIVHITSIPDKAKVLDGDIEVGTTPLSGLKLSVGSHTLTLKKSKYHTQAFTVDIKDGINRIPEKTLAPNFGTLKITSLPAGAKVKINGMLKQGTTPLTFDEFQSGFYEIEVERDRYFAEKKSVEVKDLQVTEQTFTLKPQFADVTINSTPSGAKVYLDNEYIGTTPLMKKGEAEGILAGKYNLRLTMNSDLYIDYEDAITVKAGEPLTKTIDIKSNFGTIKIVTEMTGVKVMVNGIENKEFSRDLQARLKPGNYEIEILKDKHQPVKKTVSLADGAVETIQAQFIAKQGRIMAYSVPDGADFTLTDETGKEIYKGKSLDQQVLIGTYTVKAQMEGYGNIKNKTITVTEGYKEPIEFAFTDEDKIKLNLNESNFIDLRDGKIYKTIKIGNQIWLAENLNYDSGEGSLCYGNNDQYCKKYGRLYTWEGSKRAVPIGWHMPTKNEWKEFLDFIGGEGSYGFNNLIGNQNIQFNILFSGYGNSDKSFSSIGSYTKYWSATEEKNNIWIVYISKGGQEIKMVNSGQLNDYYSLRLVKD